MGKVKRFLDLPRGVLFTARAYGATLFRKINGREAEVVESASYFVCSVGEIRKMGYRLYVEQRGEASPATNQEPSIPANQKE